MCGSLAFLRVGCFAKDLKYVFFLHILNLKLSNMLMWGESKTMTKNIGVR
jgi:hypothetical protein